MTKYARLFPTTGLVDTVLDLTPEQFAAMQVNGKAAHLRAYSVDAKPTPSSTQRVQDAGVVIDATSARQTWSLVDLTADELDAVAQAGEMALLKQAVAAMQADIAAPITDATTVATCIAHIHALEVRMRRVERVAVYFIKSLRSGQ